MGVYCKHYGTQHVLIRLVEQWRAIFDQNKITGAALLYLSKAFSCIPHDFLIAKLNAHEFDREALQLIDFYLKEILNGKLHFLCSNTYFFMLRTRVRFKPSKLFIFSRFLGTKYNFRKSKDITNKR